MIFHSSCLEQGENILKKAIAGPSVVSANAASNFDPEVLRSGFGFIFYFGLAKFRRIAHRFLSKFCGNFFAQIFQPCFSRAAGPPGLTLKSSPLKFTPKIVGIALQFQIFEPTSVRYFRKPLRGPPTHGVPKPPSNKKEIPKNPKTPLVLGLSPHWAPQTAISGLQYSLTTEFVLTDVGPVALRGEASSRTGNFSLSSAMQI